MTDAGAPTARGVLLLGGRDARGVRRGGYLLAPIGRSKSKPNSKSKSKSKSRPKSKSKPKGDKK